MTSVTPKTIAELDEMRARAMHPMAWSTDAPWSFRGMQANGQSEEVTADKWWERNKGIRSNTLAAARAIRYADAAAGLTTVHGFGSSVAPHEAVKDCYPLVLYFPAKADADEFVALIQEAKPGMVAVEVTEG